MRLIMYSILLLSILISCRGSKELIDEKMVEERIVILENLVEPEPIMDLVVMDEAPMSVGPSFQEDLINIVEVENSRTTSSTESGGHVVYKIPNEMTVRSTYQVVVRISKSKAHIYENLNGEVKTTIIPITKTMEVKLVDPSPSDHKMFDIIPDNTAVQMVDDGDEYTQWTWNITPVRSGTSKLKIVISIIRDGNTKETVYVDDVVVRADVTKSVPFFLKKYWQWMLSTLVIPLGIWLYKRRKKDKE